MNRGWNNISSVNSYATHFSDYKQIKLIVTKKEALSVVSFYDTTDKQRKGFHSKLRISQNFNKLLRDLRIGSECNRGSKCQCQNSNYDLISLIQLNMLDLIHEYHKIM